MIAHRIGLIVNPIAGMGGAVGLKGTDGSRLAVALERGARPVASGRAARALRSFTADPEAIRIFTCAGNMGEEAVREAGLVPHIVYRARIKKTNEADSRAAAERLLAADVELILFAGGDGTARDLLQAVGNSVPVLGIPAGVKMHSAVFAPSPGAAGDIAVAFLGASNRDVMLHDAEVMDRDDSGGSPSSPALFGTLRVPASSLWVPHPKASGNSGVTLKGACRRAARIAADDAITLIGPGATMGAIKRLLGFEGTLLGVDAVHRGQLLAADVDERRILELLHGREGRIFVSIVGGQGFLFGRGNQQFSPSVIRRVGRDRIVIVSDMDKLASLQGRPLLVDSGDETLDRDLSGYLPVMVGRRRTVQCLVCAAADVLDAAPAVPVDEDRSRA